MDQWFYVVNGQQQGPVSSQQLIAMITAGQLDPATMVWNESLPQWSPANTVLLRAGDAMPGNQVQYQTPTTPLHQPTGDGIPLSQDSTIFWLRVGGRLIDAIALYIINLILTLPINLVMGIRQPVFNPNRPFGPQSAAMFAPLLFSTVISTVALWLYYALFESSKFQATPGKMACQLRVIDYQGQRISFARASGRAFGSLISFYTCCFLYLMAAFTERKQTLHDIMAGTLVVRRNSIIG